MIELGVADGYKSGFRISEIAVWCWFDTGSVASVGCGKWQPVKATRLNNKKTK
jgi:hypothetical protein